MITSVDNNDDTADLPVDEPPPPLDVGDMVRELAALPSEARVRRVLAIILSEQKAGPGLLAASQVLTPVELEQLVLPSLDADRSTIVWWMDAYVPKIGVRHFVEILQEHAAHRTSDLSKALYHLPHLVRRSDEAAMESLNALRRLVRGT